jgi:hypothetical protein
MTAAHAGGQTKGTSSRNPVEPQKTVMGVHGGGCPGSTLVGPKCSRAVAAVTFALSFVLQSAGGDLFESLQRPGPDVRKWLQDTGACARHCKHMIGARRGLTGKLGRGEIARGTAAWSCDTAPFGMHSAWSEVSVSVRAIHCHSSRGSVLRTCMLITSRALQFRRYKSETVARL